VGLPSWEETVVGHRLALADGGPMKEAYSPRESFEERSIYP
jgi:hypothetical protein